MELNSRKAFIIVWRLGERHHTGIAPFLFSWDVEGEATQLLRECGAGVGNYIVAGVFLGQIPVKGGGFAGEEEAHLSV